MQQTNFISNLSLNDTYDDHDETVAVCAVCVVIVSSIQHVMFLLACLSVRLLLKVSMNIPEIFVRIWPLAEMVTVILCGSSLSTLVLRFTAATSPLFHAKFEDVLLGLDC